MEKPKALNIRLSSEDDRRLKLLSEHYGISPGSVIRMLIKRDFDRVSAESSLSTVEMTP